MKADTTYSSPDDTDRVYAVVSRCFGVPRKQLTAKTSLVEDLGVDSIDLLALAINLEEEFDLVITDRDIGCFHTIGDTIVYIVGVCELRRFESEAASLS